jgi:hypothetical protein
MLNTKVALNLLCYLQNVFHIFLTIVDIFPGFISTSACTGKWIKKIQIFLFLAGPTCQTNLCHCHLGLALAMAHMAVHPLSAQSTRQGSIAQSAAANPGPLLLTGVAANRSPTRSTQVPSPPEVVHTSHLDSRTAWHMPPPFTKPAPMCVPSHRIFTRTMTCGQAPAATC